MDNILTLLIFFPLATLILGIFINEKFIKIYAIFASFIELVFTLLLYINFDVNSTNMQFTKIISLVPSYGINYHVAVDGISLFLVIMTNIMTFVSFIALSEKKEVKKLVLTIFLLQVTMVGVFVSLDAIIFYLFWELSLVPMLYIIGAWGGNLRVYAAIKFFIYTFLGSLIMLVGMLYLAYIYYETTGVFSFNLLEWNKLILPFDMQLWLFLAFFAGFAIKVPMFPFHTWLPYAHGQAPTVGSVLLAAVLLKMGTYGFVRFSLPLFPDASVYFMLPMAILAIIAIIYTAMVAYAQEDIKQIIAYSSISHMGVIILGIFSLNVEGITGAIFLMISHGIVSGGLFLLVGVLYDRRKTKLIKEFSGLAKVMPKFSLVFAIMLMASIGLPLTIGFIGEFLSLLGFFKNSIFLTLLAGLTIILGAVYMLVLYKKVVFGIANEKSKLMKDLDKKESVSLIFLTFLVIFLGLYPKPILKPANNSVSKTIELMYSKAVTQKASQKIYNLNSIEGIK